MNKRKHYSLEKRCPDCGTLITDVSKKCSSCARRGKSPWNKGKTLSKEYRDKLSKAHKGIQAGKNHPMWGKHHSEESKKKMSLRRKGVWIGENNPNWGKDMSGENSPTWRGGITVSDGRYYIHDPENPMSDDKGYVARSRLVMSEHLGRTLFSDEVVHHINGITDDDRIKNLELTSRKEHVKIHKPRSRLWK